MLNLIKLTVLGFVLVFIASFLGHAVLGDSGRVGGAAIGILGCVLIYTSAEQTLLALFKPKVADITTFPILFQIVTEVSSKIGIAMPNIYILEEPQPNLFSIGVYTPVSSIVVTSGLLRILDRRELTMAIAHECSHILNRDTFTSTITTYLASFLTAAADYIHSPTNPDSARDNNVKKSRYGGIHYILGLLLNVLAAILIQALISRSDDLTADEQAATALKDPKALANALQKIQKTIEHHPMPLAQKHPSTFAMFLVSPSIDKDFISELFVTQSRTSERIKRLEKIETS